MLLRIASEPLQEARHLVCREALLESESREPVLVKPLREAAEQVVLGIGRRAVDHQLIARDADSEDGRVGEEGRHSPHDALLRGGERRMPARIHRAPVECDGELNEEIRELPGERRR